MSLERVRCPACRREVPWAGNAFRPFCSERCKLSDLGGWAAERYRIPGADLADESESEDEDPGSGSGTGA